MGFLETLDYDDYIFVHKLVLAFYVLVGPFILKFLIHDQIRFVRNDKNILVTYLLFLIVFAGTRGLQIGTDTFNYYSNYFLVAAEFAPSYFAIFELLETDFFFKILVSLSYWHKSSVLFFISVAFVYNYTLYLFARRFTDYGRSGSSLILFLTLASSFSFLSLEMNIIRNALSIGFVLMGLFYATKQEHKKWVMFLLVAFLFHKTAIIPFVIVATIVMARKVGLKYFLMFYGLAIGLSFLGFGFHSVPFLGELGYSDAMESIYDIDIVYNVGFRIDFVAYNTLFLLLFLKFSNFKNDKDELLIKYYILTSAVFFFNFYIPFSDRFGIYSWLIIPLLLFSTINDRFPERKVFISTIVLSVFYILNNLLLFS